MKSPNSSSIKKNSHLVTGFLQALGVSTYCFLVGSLMFNFTKIFSGPPSGVLAPLTMLTLLIVSALTCGLIVFYKPYQLFISGHKKQASLAVVSTTLWLILILFLVIAIPAIIRIYKS